MLGPGQGYRAPTVYFAWSGEGLDGIAGAFHAMLRGRAAHPARPRPLLVNTWEAVYFDHDATRLLSLVDKAASVGAERVVLDDGWFEGRRDDSNGLGDWFVDKDVWPEGLWPIVNRARSHGMQFGLWFEPEMVNLGSRIIGEHPEWLLAPSRGAGPAIRNQYVLNIAHPAAWDYVFGRIDEVVGEYSIDYIKWDHNRELHEAARRDANDRPGVNAQTRALYRMLDALKSRHPSLEIESCASGGGRVDLGILAAHRPGVDLGLQRSRRAAADPAVDGAAHPAGADGRPRGLGPVAHDQPDQRRCPSGWSPPCSGTPASRRT